MGDHIRCSVVFFDLGNTLVIPDSGWVPGAKTELNVLDDRGIRLGIISNTKDWTRDELARHLPNDFRFTAFEDRLVVLSSEVHAEKPSPEIFEIAIERARETQPDIVAQECLFCTETLLDTLVAQAVGMRTCRLSYERGAIDITGLSGMLREAALLT